MTLEEITRQLENNGNTKEEQIRIIRKNRAQLLDEIHGKQQLLDQLGENTSNEWLEPVSEEDYKKLK